MSQSNTREGDNTSKPEISIPEFQPLPPTSFPNRIINKILAPIFYLLFAIITSIIVVPVYTIIQNIKGRATKGRSHRKGGKGGEKVGRDYSDEVSMGGIGGNGGSKKGRNRVGEFLGGVGDSYGKERVH